MGLYPSAELIYGIPISASDENDEYTPYWSEWDCDWVELPESSLLTIRPFGHCNDDEQRAFLSPKNVPAISGDAWVPKLIEPDALDVWWEIPQLTADAERCGFDVNFADDAAWFLVASYG